MTMRQRRRRIAHAKIHIIGIDFGARRLRLERELPRFKRRRKK